MLFYYIAGYKKNFFMLQRVLYVLIVVTVATSVNHLNAQENSISDLYRCFTNYYSSGDFINAERCLLKVLESKETPSDEVLIATNNNLGVLNNLLGRYDEALNYYNSAEVLIANQKQYSLSLADIYINKARIYGIVREYDKAIEYLEQGIKIYFNIKKNDKSTLFRISTAFLNLGLTCFEKKNYNSSLQYLEKSIDIKLKNNLSEIALPYLNIAKTYAKINEPYKAQQYFLRSITSFNNEFGNDYYRTSSVLFDYGLFLQLIGRNQEALETHQKALSICLKNYGNKHPFVSVAYKLIGDHFYSQFDFKTALTDYQKSLIAVINNFNDSSIYSNPSLDSVIFDIRLLDNLKAKAQALEQLALLQKNGEAKLKNLRGSFETIELALRLIGRIRNGYVSTESKIYLAENEKETYLFATGVAQQLYEQTKNPEYLQRMYSIACLSKSAVLRNEITENELLYRSGIPDSLKASHYKLIINIASYSKLVQDELQKTKPDTHRIDLWKDALFEMSRSKERLDGKIKELFPQYETLINKTEPASLKEIQGHLAGDETLVEYFLSNRYTKGGRELYIFLISQNRLDYQVTTLDSIFAGSVKAIKLGTVNSQYIDAPRVTYRSYTDALYYMYEKLVKPVEPKLAGSKLIIVPDEEISYLPFDAFIRQRADTGQTSYGGLRYLIYDYTISYGYTSSLIFQNEEERVRTSKVYAFSPDYRNSQKGLDTLQGARSEIGSIFEWFDGSACYGAKATESSFKRLIRQPAIFHLAMHSQTDSSNSKYSFMIFDHQSDSTEDGRLFNYEISMSRISSPMVVLSACNTGTGDLYHGEGVMSLTRGFILAGASSVVNTFWDVNDEASADIISDFYHQISKGEGKDDALRRAKLNYLKNTPSMYWNPYYWAAYEVMGDRSPIKRSPVLLLLLGGFLVLASGLFVGYRLYFRGKKNI